MLVSSGTRPLNSSKRSTSNRGEATSGTCGPKFCPRQYSSAFVEQLIIETVSELCHIPPENPGEHRKLQAQVDAHRCWVKSLIGKCVGGISCASARADRVAFQACAIDHSAISPL